MTHRSAPHLGRRGVTETISIAALALALAVTTGCSVPDRRPPSTLTLVPVPNDTARGVIESSLATVDIELPASASVTSTHLISRESLEDGVVAELTLPRSELPRLAETWRGTRANTTPLPGIYGSDVFPERTTGAHGRVEGTRTEWDVVAEPGDPAIVHVAVYTVSG